MKPEEFQAELAKHGLEVNSAQMEQFSAYYRLLVEWNQKMNLTAITEKEEVYLKHFYDSLTLLFLKNFKLTDHYVMWEQVRVFQAFL